MTNLLLFRWDRSRSRWITGWHSGWGTGWSTAVGATSGRTAIVAATFDNVVSTQAEGLFSLTNHTAIAVTQSTGQGGDDFGAAAAVLANLIADFIGSFTSDAFISIIQSVDEGRHDLWIADAIITIAQLADGSTSLTSIAGRL